MLLVLVAPALIVLVAVLVRTRRSTLVTAVLLTVATVLGLASIGMFLIPTVALAWVAVGASKRSGRNIAVHSCIVGGDDG